MAFLSRVRKNELRSIAEELGVDISQDLKVPELRKLILDSESYDEVMVKGMIENLIDERSVQHELELKRAERELELKKAEQELELKKAEREQELELKKAEREQELELKRAEREHELELKKAEREHELELKRLEIAAQTSTTETSSLRTETVQSAPRIDWQSQLHIFDSKNEDISLYLVHFERVMKRVQMPKSLWMACLINQLPTDIVQMIMREPEEEADNFEYVKTLLLKRFKLSPEKLRQLFFSHHNSDAKSWREYCHELETYFNGWIMGLEIKTFEQLKDLIISDQIKRKTPTEIREYYLDQWAKFISPLELAEKIDDFIDLKNTFKKSTVPVMLKDRENKYEFSRSERTTRNENLRSKPAGPNTCFNCYEEGHFARDCTKPKRLKFCTICKKDGHGTKECSQNVMSPLVNATMSSFNYGKDVITKAIKVGGIATDALMDTAADISMIKRHFAKEINAEIFDKATILIRGIGGHRKSLGVTKLDVVIDSVTLKKVHFHVMSDDTFDGPNVLIGNNFIDAPDLVMIRKHGQSKLLHADEFNMLSDYEFEELPQKIVLRTVEPVTIKPQTVQLVTVASRDEFIQGLVTRNSFNHGLHEQGFIINNGKTQVPIINPSKEDLRLKKNRVILRGIWINDDTNDNDNYPSEVESLSVNTVREIIREPIRCDEVKVSSNVTDEQHQCICDLLNEFRFCIARKPDELGCINNTTMHITEIPGSKPVTRSPYRASNYERKVLREITCELKEQGVIRDSNSEYSSPVLLVPKKTGEYRMVIDYRQLNRQTVKDKFPLPCLDDLLDRLSGFNLFCILDACQGFNQIPMDDESSRKAAFTTPDGHFEPTRLFFGLSNGPPVFQRAMSLALGNLMWNNVTCFIDDIFFGSYDFDDMMKKLREILERLQKAGVTLKLSKCEFAQSEVQYLGFVVSREGIRPGQRKLAAISEFPLPKTKEELRRFLGLTSFFRRFVACYATIAEPLCHLLKTDQPFEWCEEQQKAFEVLREKLVSKPILKLFDPRDETELHTDASSLGIAGMLLQRDKDNTLRLVYCVSRRTHPNERNYHSSRLELIAVVWSMTRLRPLLLGLRFTLITDCSAITYLNTQKNIKPQIARLSEQISEFNYDVKHRPHLKMAHVDALSRAPIEERDSTPLHEIEFTSPVELVSNPTVFYIVTKEDRVALIQSQDKDLQNIIGALKKSMSKRTKYDKQVTDNFELISGILYRQHEIKGTKNLLFVMPRSMRKYLAVRYHDFSGHYGAEKVVNMIRQQFWFPKMTNYVKQHIKQCVTCAFIKTPSGKVQGKLNPIPCGERPFQVIHMDFLGPMVTTLNRNKEIFVIIDNLTKFVRLRSSPSCSTKCVLRNFDEFINDFGSPYRVITDRGTCFTSTTFEEYCNKYGIKHTLISSQRPQANGQVERINRVLIPMISSNVSTLSHSDWDKILPEAQRCINWSPSKSTGKSPFELLYGFIPIKHGYFPQELLPTSNDYVSPDKLQKEASENIIKAQSQMKSYYDARHCNAYQYSVGDVVVVRRLPESTGKSTKTQVKYRGPLVVVDVLPSDTYRVTDLRDSGQGRGRKPNYTTTAHASQMKLFHIVNNEDDLVDSDSDFENDDVDNIACVPRHNSAIIEEANNVSNPPQTLTKRKRKLPSHFKDFEL